MQQYGYPNESEFPILLSAEICVGYYGFAVARSKDNQVRSEQISRDRLEQI